MQREISVLLFHLSVKHKKDNIWSARLKISISGPLQKLIFSFLSVSRLEIGILFTKAF